MHSDRSTKCPKCSKKLNRDVLASRNIAMKADKKSLINCVNYWCKREHRSQLPLVTIISLVKLIKLTIYTTKLSSVYSKAMAAVVNNDSTTDAEQVERKYNNSQKQNSNGKQKSRNNSQG